MFSILYFFCCHMVSIWLFFLSICYRLCALRDQPNSILTFLLSYRYYKELKIEALLRFAQVWTSRKSGYYHSSFRVYTIMFLSVIKFQHRMVLYACYSSGWATMMGRLLGLKATLHQESNQGLQQDNV